MKISQEHYEHIRDAVGSVVSKNGPEKIAAFRATQTMERQFRWNLLWAAGISDWMCSTLYPLGVQDDHIDTALRKAVKELGLDPGPRADGSPPGAAPATDTAATRRE